MKMLKLPFRDLSNLSVTILKTNNYTTFSSFWLIRLSSTSHKVQTAPTVDNQNEEQLEQDTKKSGEQSKLGVATSEKNPYKFPYKKPKLKFQLQGVEFGKYTHIPIPYPKTGGRDWSGRVFNKRIGGGARQKYRMIDYSRKALSEEEPLVERVLQIHYDPLRSADIALVSSGIHKRWILAGEDMKVGDLLKSFAHIPDLPVPGKVGDAHPVGALPVGSVVHNIEKYPGEGGRIARAAGTSGTIIMKVGDDQVVVKMPSEREMCIDKHCMVTVGRASNVDHHTEHIGSAARNRWFGVRPKSGLWQKKSGYHGRKMRPPKPMVTYEKKTKKPLHEIFDT